IADNDTGLQIIDVSDPAAPALVGSLNTSGGTRAVSIAGNYAYIADNDTGLQIIDVSDPAAPALVGSLNTSGGTRAVSIAGNYAYAVSNDASLHVIDISDPAVPVLLAHSDECSLAVGICLLGNYLYIADEESSLHIYDVSQPFKLSVSPISRYWRIKLGLTDAYGNASYATRTVWTVPYNNAPSIEGIDISRESGNLANSVGRLHISGCFASRIYTLGTYAYLIGSREGVLKVVDVSDPAAPALVGSLDTSSYAYDVYVSGNYAYLAGSNAGLQIIDVSDPAAPALVGRLDTSGFARGVHVSGNYAYIANDKAGLHIVDVSDPTAPTLVGSIELNGTSKTVCVSGNYAYVACWSGGLQIIDVSNPASPVLVGSFDTSCDFVDVSGNYAYIANDCVGLQIVDVSNPASPVLVGSLDEYPAFKVRVSGKYAYVVNTYDELLIIDISDPAAPALFRKLGAMLDIRDVFVSGDYIYVTNNEFYTFYSYSLSIVEGREEQPSLIARAVGAADPDIYTTWDSMLEYRWDFDNDNVWDTGFLNEDSIVLPYHASAVACEVRDRFSATAKAEASIMGDVNGDGRITRADIRKMHAAMKGSVTLSEEEFRRADVYPNPGTEGRVRGDGKITKHDTWRLYRYIFGHILNSNL
ncbi:MAG: hypothetical protein PHR44_03575, partial [Candidatus Omnitrophica bacterium]|nr:hypothetical protein [Candidatus Omnitrophota bacterium]